MSWVKDVLALVQSVATLTKDVERSTSEIKELRKDVNELAGAVRGLMNQIQHEKERTGMVLDSYKNEMAHLTEGTAAKFQMLTTMLDQKIDGFESRFASAKPRPPRRRAIANANPLKKS